MNTVGKNYAIRFAIAGSGIALVLALITIIKSFKDPMMLLLSVLIIGWQVYFVKKSLLGLKVSVSRITSIRMGLYFVLQVLLSLPILLLIVSGGINLSCRDCQGAGGIVALFLLGLLIFGLITLALQIMALVSLRKDVSSA